MADTRKAFLRLLDKTWPDISKALGKSLKKVALEAPIGELRDAIDSGDVDEVIRLLGLNKGALAPVYEAVRSAVIAGGGYQIAAYGSQLRGGFDPGNPEAEAFMKDRGARLVTRVTDDTKQSIRDIVARGLSEGRNPRDLVTDLVGVTVRGKGRVGGVIGLTPQQAQWKKSAELELLGANDPDVDSENYFSRTRRDKRYDSQVRKHLSGKKKMTKKQIQVVVGRYSDRLKATRAESIARTEALSSLNGGRYLSMEQVIDDGQADVRFVTKTWDSTNDSKVRDTHKDAEGQKQPFNDDFNIGGYPMKYPGDSSRAPAEETVRCRCYMSIEVDWLAQAEEQRLAA